MSSSTDLLSDTLLAEIRLKAADYVAEKKWEELQWDDAWAWKYAEPSTEADIEAAFPLLYRDAVAYKNREWEPKELDDSICMIYLESCASWSEVYACWPNVALDDGLINMEK